MPTRRGRFTDTPSGSRLATIAAFASLLIVPLVPGALAAGSVGAVIGLPAESLAVVLLLLVIPSVIVRRVIAGGFGAVVVVAIVVAALDLGFESTVSRPFSPVDDWPGVLSAAGVIGDATGTGGLILIVGAIGMASAALAWALARAALRAARVIGRSGRDGRTAVTAVVATWALCAVLGAQVVPGVPFAASDTTRTLTTVTAQTAQSIHENAQFRAALRTDTARGIPSDRLLSALAGKDVVIAFIESYGRTAVEGTDFSVGVDRVLQEGGDRLAADGYEARSAFLTSPTFGGVSWLAHATLQSGV